VLNGSGVPASIVEGAKSQFDVISDGELVFSKQREGRFPEEDEVLALLASSR
jgi:predicted Rdx family selenoprotein